MKSRSRMAAILLSTGALLTRGNLASGQVVTPPTATVIPVEQVTISDGEIGMLVAKDQATGNYYVQGAFQNAAMAWTRATPAQLESVLVAAINPYFTGGLLDSVIRAVEGGLTIPPPQPPPILNNSIGMRSQTLPFSPSPAQVYVVGNTGAQPSQVVMGWASVGQAVGPTLWDESEKE